MFNTTGSSLITLLCGSSTSALLLVSDRRWRAFRVPILGALVGAGMPTLFIAGVHVAVFVT